MKDLELLAPARNADIGIAAIDCGADAVYIAGPAFGARQAAGNSIADVRRLCDYAHRFGARVFITLNTILYDSEIEDARRLLEEAARTGVDAVIAQDMALLQLNSDSGARLPLHASTQCAIRTPQKAAELESLGFSRLILERELSLSQIKEIAASTSCEIECFVHGALCVCYSGQCYMSECVAGRSSNRGACVQACRSRYDLVDSDGRTIVRDKALLSLKDYNLKSRLGDLADAGVTSFKIEGRLKNISYVRNLVRDYSLALDEIVEKSGGKYRRASFGRVTKGFTPDGAKTFNRGYTELFIDGKRGKWAAMEATGSMGEDLGTVTNLSSMRDSFTIRPSKAGIRLSNGDGFAFVSQDSEVRGVRADLCDGLRVKCKRTPELFEGARIFRNFDSTFEKEMAANPCVRHMGVTISAAFAATQSMAALSDTPSTFATTQHTDVELLDDTIQLPEGTERRSMATARVTEGAERKDDASKDEGPAGGRLMVTARSEDGREITKSYTDLWSDFALNPDRVRSMFASQLSKTSGHLAFHFERLVCEGDRLPLLSAASLNFIRNDIAAALGEIPCRARPLYNAATAEENNAGEARTEGDANKTRTEDNANKTRTEGDANKTRPEDNAEETCAHKTATYKDNISNRMAAEVYRKAGYTTSETAYEITHRPGAELMRTKYCIRHELGLCPKQIKAGNTTPPSASPHTGGAAPLYLINNGKRFTAVFDCAACEMTIKI